MATFVETAVKVAIELRRDPVDGDRVIISAYSVAEDGTPLRSESGFDVTALLNQTQQDETTNLLDAAESYYRTKWNIA